MAALLWLAVLCVSGISSGETACQTVTLRSSSDSGYIYSPGYPSNYQNNEYRCWQITADVGVVAESASLQVALEVVDSELERNTFCTYDYVSVKESASENGSVIQKWCGDENPGLIISPGPSMYVLFRSDNSFRYKGFRARYFTVSSPVIGVGNAKYNDSGCTTYAISQANVSYILSTPNYPNDYRHNSVLCWVLYVVPRSFPDYAQYLVQLNIVDSLMETSTRCAYDSASVYDGDSASAALIRTWCGTENPPTLLSCGLTMYVRFISDKSVSYRGFRGTFSAVHNSSITECGASAGKLASSVTAYLVGITVSVAGVVLCCSVSTCVFLKQNNKTQQQVHPPLGVRQRRLPGIPRPSSSPGRRGRVSSAWSPDDERGISPPPPYPGTPPGVFFTAASQTVPPPAAGDSNTHQGASPSAPRERIPLPADPPPTYEETIARFGSPSTQVRAAAAELAVHPTRPDFRSREVYLLNNRRTSGRRRSAQSHLSLAPAPVTLNALQVPTEFPPGTVVTSPRQVDEEPSPPPSTSRSNGHFQLPTGEEVTPSAPPSPAIYRSPTPGTGLSTSRSGPLRLSESSEQRESRA